MEKLLSHEELRIIYPKIKVFLHNVSNLYASSKKWSLHAQVLLRLFRGKCSIF